MPEVRIPAFAKINLRLDILGKRGDGYHELRTIFQLRGGGKFRWSSAAMSDCPGSP
jgi:hypothetical protein